MNPTSTPAASVAAKAITRRMPAFDDDNCRQQSTTCRTERYTMENGRIVFRAEARTAPPRLLPGVCVVQVGPLPFEIRRVIGGLYHPKHGAANGLCYYEELAIFIDCSYPTATRLHTLWHELSHAMFVVYNTGQREKLDEESICDSVAGLMAGITPEKYAEIVAFVTAPEGGAA